MNHVQCLPFLLGSGGSGDVDVNIGLGWIDNSVILIYLVGIVLLGCWAGLRKKAQSDGGGYFLAGKSLSWPIIGLALFATNISTIHLVSFPQSGYTTGLLYGNYEWMAAFTLVILALFFAPFYIRSRVATLPDFLEKRYNRGCRDVWAVVSIFSAILVHIGFTLLTGAIVLEGTILPALDIQNPEQYRLITVVALCGVTAIYTIVGGLMAVVITEAVQTVILLIGAVCITALGLYMLGGWDGQTFADLYYTGYMVDGWETMKASVHPQNFSIARPDCDPSGTSWYAVLLGYPVLGIWYWCTDQTIVQRVLGAKNEDHARIGPIFAGLLKVLPVFLFVVPGLICLSLIQSGTIDPLPTASGGGAATEKTYTHMIQHVLPLGMRGIVVAALLAALMSTVSGALNSIATLVSYDLYKRWAPNTSDKSLVRIGQFVTFLAMCVAIGWTLMISGGAKSIFQKMVDLLSFVAPPPAVVFTLGVFWRRGSGVAGLVTLIVGFLVGILGAIVTLYEWNYIGDYQITPMLAAFIIAALLTVLYVVLSLIYPHKHTEESEQLVWKSPLAAFLAKPKNWALDHRFWSLVLVVGMGSLYWIYWGEENYYAIEGQVTNSAGEGIESVEVIFDCDDDRFDFTSVTTVADEENDVTAGNYSYGVKLAGGAPAGTVYTVAIRPVPPPKPKEGEEAVEVAPPTVAIPDQFQSLETTPLKITVKEVPAFQTETEQFKYNIKLPIE